MITCVTAFTIWPMVNLGVLQFIGNVIFLFCSRCITNQRALLESGTMGAKGHVQVGYSVHCLLPFVSEQRCSLTFWKYKCWSCVLQLIRCLESSQFQNCRMLTYVGTYELTAKFTLNPTLRDFQHCCVQLLWLVKRSILSINIVKQQKSILYTWLSHIKHWYHPPFIRSPTQTQ